MPFPLLGLLLKRGRRTVDDPEQYRLTLGEHLEELRTRIIRIIALLAIGWTAGWFLQPVLYDFLQHLVEVNIRSVLKNPDMYREAFKNATEPFMLKFRLSFLIGLILVFPLCVLQLWGFIAPGLKPNERKPVARLAPLSVILFLLGAFFCWIILPTCLQWFAVFILDFPGTSLIQEPGSMVYFVLKMMLAFGIGFQLPLVVYALGAVGLLSAETLIKYWRQAATFVFIAAAIITPSNDAFSMLMMAVPLCILFMVSVYFVKLTQRKKKKAAEAEEAGYYPVLDEPDTYPADEHEHQTSAYEPGSPGDAPESAGWVEAPEEPPIARAVDDDPVP